MDPHTVAPNSGGGRYLQGVWMSNCEGGRVERLTKWSDDKRDREIGSFDKQEHNSLVKINLVQLELRDELETLRKSRRANVREKKEALRARDDEARDVNEHIPTQEWRVSVERKQRAERKVSRDQMQIHTRRLKLSAKASARSNDS